MNSYEICLQSGRDPTGNDGPCKRSLFLYGAVSRLRGLILRLAFRREEGSGARSLDPRTGFRWSRHVA